MKPLGLVAAAVALLWLAAASCSDDGHARSLGKPTATAAKAQPEWEAVVLAGSATVTDVDDPGLPGGQVLELGSTDPKVTMFSDRPTRKAGDMDLQEFLALWHRGGFGQDPPNAAVLAGGKVQAVELTKAVYDPATARIAFVVDELDTTDGKPGGLLSAGSLGPAALFVDAIGAVNAQITDAVTPPSVKVIGVAPAPAMGSLYQTVGQSLGLAAQNAESQGLPASMYAQATTAQNVPLIYSVDTDGKAYSWFVNPGG